MRSWILKRYIWMSIWNSQENVKQNQSLIALASTLRRYSRGAEANRIHALFDHRPLQCTPTLQFDRVTEAKPQTNQYWKRQKKKHPTRCDQRITHLIERWTTAILQNRNQAVSHQLTTRPNMTHTDWLKALKCTDKVNKVDQRLKALCLSAFCPEVRWEH